MKHKSKLLLAAALVSLAVSGCNSNAPEDSPAVIDKNASYAGVSCLEVQDDPETVMPLFHQMQKDGKENGYTPLIILRDSHVTDEMLEFSRQKYGDYAQSAAEYLKACKAVDPEDWFSMQRRRYDSVNAFDFSWYEDFCENPPDPDIVVTTPDDITPQTELFLGFGSDTVYIAKMPADHPYETLAYFPMGGFNACPETEVLMAAAKKWYEEYDAVLCAAGSDTLQFYLEQPVKDKQTARKAAEEMYMLCPDIVDQGVCTLDNLEKSILGSHYWYFWWD